MASASRSSRADCASIRAATSPSPERRRTSTTAIRAAAPAAERPGRPSQGRVAGPHGKTRSGTLAHPGDAPERRAVRLVGGGALTEELVHPPRQLGDLPPSLLLQLGAGRPSPVELHQPPGDPEHLPGDTAGRV